MNKVMLMGRLTKDVDLSYTPNGVAVAKFTLAVNRRFKREGQNEADFINCVVWQKTAESTANHVKKGCRVNIVGRWETRSYDGQDGKKVYVNECIVEEINFIDFANAQDSQNNSENNHSNTNTHSNNQNTYNSQNNGYNPLDTNDDDLPF